MSELSKHRETVEARALDRSLSLGDRAGAAIALLSFRTGIGFSLLNEMVGSQRAHEVPVAERACERLRCLGIQLDRPESASAAGNAEALFRSHHATAAERSHAVRELLSFAPDRGREVLFEVASAAVPADLVDDLAHLICELTVAGLYHEFEWDRLHRAVAEAIAGEFD